MEEKGSAESFVGDLPDGMGSAGTLDDADPEPRRSRSSRILWSAAWILLVGAIFYYSGKQLFSHLHEKTWRELHVQHWAVLACLACLLGMRFLNALATRLILRSLGMRVGTRWAAGAVWVSAPGRYVPGKMVAGLSSAFIMTRRGVPLVTAAAATFLFTALTVFMGMVFSVPLLLTRQMRHDWPGAWMAAVAMIIIGMVFLHPRLFMALSNQVLRVMGRPRMAAHPALRAYLGAMGLIVIRALLVGAAAWCAARSFGDISLARYPVILGAMSLAGVVGFLAFVVPAGLGVQESVLLLTLTGLLGPENAALLALLLRALQVIADILAAVAGLIVLHPRLAGHPPSPVVVVLPSEPEPEDLQALSAQARSHGVKPIPAIIRHMPHKPNFFIVGAAKCGTTSLYDYLCQHPQVFMSPHKEPHYFARDFSFPPEWCIREPDRYIEQFAGAAGAKAIGEASVWYIYSPVAPWELKEFSPDARIIAMLRDPVDMMYSLHGQFLWNCNDDIMDFQQTLAAQEQRAIGLRIPPEAHAPFALQYMKVAAFSPQIRRYYEVFGRDRVHVVLFDDLIADTAGEYRKVLRHLDVDEAFTPTFEVVNPVKPIIPWLNRFLARRPMLRRSLHMALPSKMIRKINYALPYLLPTLNRPRRISPELRARLIAQFAPEIDALEKLLGRDLSAWRQVERHRPQKTPVPSGR